MILLARFAQIINNHPVKFLLLFVWFGLLLFTSTVPDLLQYGGFTALGVVGAVFANATGAGGGVVFVPFFNQLALSSETIVATSFAIQCCGMTAGAIAWFAHYRSLGQSPQSTQWQSMPKGLVVSIPASLIGIWFAQFALSEYTQQVQLGLHFYFGIFSILLAMAIFASIPLMKRDVFKTHMSMVDTFALLFIGFFGGIITAWLSVGVGELVAVYMILRGFSISFAIALAVILSAFSVHGAIYYHLFVSQAVYWQIVIFAGAGAIVGGTIAKYVVLYFSPVKLKVFFASWVLIMGLAGLPIW